MSFRRFFWWKKGRALPVKPGPRPFNTPHPAASHELSRARQKAPPPFAQKSSGRANPLRPAPLSSTTSEVRSASPAGLTASGAHGAPRGSEDSLVDGTHWDDVQPWLLDQDPPRGAQWKPIGSVGMCGVVHWTPRQEGPGTKSSVPLGHFRGLMRYTATIGPDYADDGAECSRQPSPDAEHASYFDPDPPAKRCDFDANCVPVAGSLRFLHGCQAASAEPGSAWKLREERLLLRGGQREREREEREREHKQK